MYTLFTFEWIDKISSTIQFNSNYQKWTGVKMIHRMYFLRFDSISNNQYYELANNNNDTLLQLYSRNQLSIYSDSLIDI